MFRFGIPILMVLKMSMSFDKTRYLPDKQIFFAIMHNGCTTAFEATISKKANLTYLPYEQKYGNELPNRLGYIVKTPRRTFK